MRRRSALIVTGLAVLVLGVGFMTAQDKTFLHGKVGFGSFDDTGNVDNIVLWGKKKE